MKVAGKTKVARSSRTNKKIEKLLHTITTKEVITLLVSIATSHPPSKCWRRPDAKCNKCNQLGHETVICRNQSEQQDVNQREQQDVNQREQQNVDAQIANEEEDVLFVATSFSSNISSAS